MNQSCGGTRCSASGNIKKGFTLMEILIVLVIITILASIVGLNVLRKPNEARIAAVKMQIKTFKTALNLYYTEQHCYPTQAQGLEALVKKPAIAPIPENYPLEGYLDSRKIPKDPWGHDYIYLSPGTKNEPYEIIDYGANENDNISSSDL